MIAVLFNADNVRLGETTIADGCYVIEFGGVIFARRSEMAVILNDGSRGIAFDQTEIAVVNRIDRHKKDSFDVIDAGGCAPPAPASKPREDMRAVAGTGNPEAHDYMAGMRSDE